MKTDLFDIVDNNNDITLGICYYRQVVKFIYKYIHENYMQNSFKDKLFLHQLSSSEYMISMSEDVYSDDNFLLNLYKIEYIDGKIKLTIICGIYSPALLAMLTKLYHQYDILIDEISFKRKIDLYSRDTVVNSYVCEHMPKIIWTDEPTKLYINKALFSCFDDFMKMCRSLYENNDKLEYLIINVETIKIQYNGVYQELYDLTHHQYKAVYRMGSKVPWCIDYAIRRNEIEYYFDHYDEIVTEKMKNGVVYC